MFVLSDNHVQVLKAKAVKLMYLCVLRGDGYGLSVGRCISIALFLFACVCIAELDALQACLKRGAGGRQWAHTCVPVCAWRAVGNAAEENRVIV